MNYISNLIKNCELALVAKPTKELKLNSIDKAPDLNGIKSAIYIVLDKSGNPQQTFSDFSEFRKRKTHSCAKLNSPSGVMYVGSSTTGVRKRIEQHIGNGNKDTYALHLNKWFSGSYEIIINEYDVSKEVLQIIEDGISFDLRPAFGKRGGNNK